METNPLEALSQNPHYRLARFILQGGGTEEERDLFFGTLCKLSPELDQMYQVLKSAQEAEAMSALEEAHPTILIAFLTGCMALETGAELVARMEAKDAILIAGLTAVLETRPSFWRLLEDRPFPGPALDSQALDRLSQVCTVLRMFQSYQKE